MKGLVSVLESRAPPALRRRPPRHAPGSRSSPTWPPATCPPTSRSPTRTFGHDLCPVAWYFAQVEPDGDVCFCGDFPDYVIGNVRSEPFTSVWKGEQARRLPREAGPRAPAHLRPLLRQLSCTGSGRAHAAAGPWARPPRPSTGAADLAAAAYLLTASIDLCSYVFAQHPALDAAAGFEPALPQRVQDRLRRHAVLDRVPVVVHQPLGGRAARAHARDSGTSRFR